MHERWAGSYTYAYLGLSEVEGILSIIYVRVWWSGDLILNRWSFCCPTWYDGASWWASRSVVQKVGIAVCMAVLTVKGSNPKKKPDWWFYCFWTADPFASRFVWLCCIYLVLLLQSINPCGNISLITPGEASICSHIVVSTPRSSPMLVSELIFWLAWYNNVSHQCLCVCQNYVLKKSKKIWRC